MLATALAGRCLGRRQFGLPLKNVFVAFITNKTSVSFTTNLKAILLNAVNMATDAKVIKQNKLKIGTHSGNLHCDEALACFMLQQLDKYKNAEIVRSRDLTVLDTCDVVVDVGNIFDPAKNRFDHHQKSFQETLSTLKPELGDQYKIRLSSAGLIYTYFGKEVIAKVLEGRDVTLSAESLDKIYIKIYEDFIEEIDAIDNGVPICEGKPNYKINTNLSARVGNFNPQWNSKCKLDENDQFEKAKNYVGEELVDKIVYYSTAWLPAREIVREALDNASKIHESLSIIELPQFCPWKAHLNDLEEERSILGRTKYAIFLEKPNDWRVMAVPIEPSSFKCRKFLHKEWRGLRNLEISKISGIENTLFCHMTGFIGGALTRQAALEMAIQSLNGDYED